MLVVVPDAERQRQDARCLPFVRHEGVSTPVLHRPEHLAQLNREAIRVGERIGSVERRVGRERVQPDEVGADDVHAAVLAAAAADLHGVFGRRKRQLFGEQRRRDVRPARAGVRTRHVIGVRLPCAEVELVGSRESQKLIVFEDRVRAGRIEHPLVADLEVFIDAVHPELVDHPVAHHPEPLPVDERLARLGNALDSHRLDGPLLVDMRLAIHPVGIENSADADVVRRVDLVVEPAEIVFGTDRQERRIRHRKRRRVRRIEQVGGLPDAQAFEVEEEERLVLENRAADVADQRLHTALGGLGVRELQEIVGCIQPAVLQVIGAAPMELVAATLGDGVDDGAGCAPVLRTEVVHQHLVFGGAVDRHAGLHAGSGLRAIVIVVGAIDHEHVV